MDKPIRRATMFLALRILGTIGRDTGTICIENSNSVNLGMNSMKRDWKPSVFYPLPFLLTPFDLSRSSCVPYANTFNLASESRRLLGTTCLISESGCPTYRESESVTNMMYTRHYRVKVKNQKKKKG